MSWVETESLSFTARHDSEDAAFADRTLDRLETLRLRLEDRFEKMPAVSDVPASPAAQTVEHLATKEGHQTILKTDLAADRQFLEEMSG